MFEFGRELKRLFGADGPKDGLTGGDASLLELLDLDTLRAEGRAADIAAGRVSAKDPAQRQLEASVVWREIARRTGDPAAVRKAASGAEQAAIGFGRTERPKDWARARCEQALAALLAADLYGEDGLKAAADHAFNEARALMGPGPSGGPAAFGHLRVEADALRDVGDRDQLAALAAQFEQLASLLDTTGRRRADARLLSTAVRVARAGLLVAGGVRLRDAALLRMAVDGATRALAGLDSTYEPLSWARAKTARATARGALAALDGDVATIAGVVDELIAVLDRLSQADSPLDWARAQLALAEVLQMLGEATDCKGAFNQAVGCHDRALGVLGDQAALIERADVVYRRAVCVARRAELFGDLASLVEAERVLRVELASLNPGRDPVGWAVRQLNFARLYEARAALDGTNRHDRAATAVALDAALEVFGEYGHRSLADTAARGLERLRAVSAAS